MSNKQILFIAPLPPPVHGSAIVSQYIRESKLINEAFDCDFVNLSTSRKMDEIGKTTPAKLWRFLTAYFIVFGRLLTRRYDLCYLAITCHGVGFLKDAPFVLMCKLFKRKIVIHQHNKGMSRYVDKQIYRHLLPWVYRGTRVILLSWRLYPDIERVVKREQVLICPNGIREVYKEEPHFERNSKIPRLLFLSNLIESKGVLILLDACKILKKKGYSFVCDFVGGETKDIDAARFANEVEKRDLNRIVVYRGRKYGTEKQQAYSEADVFVQPTYDDCFPLTLLEAEQHKLPIISTDVGAVKDIVTDSQNGLICKQRDAEDLAYKIAYLIDHPQERKVMGEEGYRLYKNNFTIHCFETQIHKILVDI